jgi:mannose-6-phosphate isomerase-like protein (cupin superfamily)
VWPQGLGTGPWEANMKISRTAVGAGVLAFVLGGAAGAQSQEQPRFMTAKALNALVDTMVNGLASTPVPTGPNATVLMAHRDRDGEVEVHAKLADELIMREGHARLQVGGLVTGQQHSTTPNEFRGGTLTGATVYDFNPGDAIYIPAGVPHQVLVPKGTTVTYMAVKFPG